MTENSILKSIPEPNKTLMDPQLYEQNLQRNEYIQQVFDLSASQNLAESINVNEPFSQSQMENAEVFSQIL